MSCPTPEAVGLPGTVSGAKQDISKASSDDLTPERRRVLELLRYYQPSTADVHNTDLGHVKLCADPSLTAFVQLGALRTDCDRSFLSLMTQECQYILAEATRTISLLHETKHGPGDSVYLGARTLNLDWGVCPTTIKVFTSTDASLEVATSNVSASRQSYIMNDMSLEECYKARPYVTGFPHMKFYAEVPLVTSSGFVIGSYCVVDNRRRENEEHDQIVETLREIADRIMDHMELVQYRHATKRAEKMIKGLNTFVEGNGTTDITSLSTTQHESAVIDAKETSNLAFQPQISGINEPSMLEDTPVVNIDEDRSLSASTSQGKDTDSPAGNDSRDSLAESEDTTGVDAGLLEPGGTDQTDKVSSVVIHATKDATRLHSSSKSIKKTLSRAGSLIREAMGLDGVMFLDPVPALHIKQEDGKSRFSSALSFSARPISNCNANTIPPALQRIPEQFLRDLLMENPHGGVFFFDQAGLISTSHNDPQTHLTSKTTAHRECREAGRLRSLLPTARSVALWPLRDSEKSAWLAIGLAWSSDAKKQIRTEDFTYLKAFGNSIMVELSRLEIVSADRAKSDFLSSISHELRSPLHGILANAELLASTDATGDQQEMISAVDLCGRTLLDTMNHLLDYAKINNFNTKTKSSQPTRNNSDNFVPESLTTSFDLSNMVQDVVQGVLSGHRHYLATTRSLSPSSESLDKSTPNSGRETKPNEFGNTTSSEVLVIMDIGVRNNWAFASEPGAWKRILMNLFGNALKYTDTGFIKVSLHAEDLPQNEHESRKSVITMEVSDSGRGMSSDYLQNHLFMHFIQEDMLSAGAGLGLSIVQQIIASMDGTIQVESKQSLGTSIKISVPLERPAEEEHTSVPPLISLQDQTRGTTLCLYGFSHDTEVRRTGLLSQTAASFPRNMTNLRNTIHSMASSWFNMKVFETSTLDSSHGDVLLTTDAALDRLSTNSGSGTNFWKDCHVPVIILRTRTDSSTTPVWDTGGAVFSTLPFGPREMAKALSSCLIHKSTRRDFAIRLKSKTVPLDSTGRSQFDKQPVADFDATRQYQDARKVKPDPSRPYHNQPALAPQHEYKTTKKTVLLVEDNGVNLKILTTYLKRLNHNYVTATNGLEAVEAYKAATTPFDLVITDISMPVMDGYTSSREIRKFEVEQGLKSVPIIALTGLASTKAQQDAHSSGITTFFTKPVRLEELKKVLE